MKKTYKVLMILQVLALLLGFGSVSFADKDSSYTKDGKFTFTPEEFCHIFETRTAEYLQKKESATNFTWSNLDIKIVLDENESTLCWVYDGDSRIAIVSLLEDDSADKNGHNINTVGLIRNVRVAGTVQLGIYEEVLIYACTPSISSPEEVEQIEKELMQDIVTNLLKGVNSGYSEYTDNGLSYSTAIHNDKQLLMIMVMDAPEEG